MNWPGQNHPRALVGIGVCFLGALFLLLRARADWNDAAAQGLRASAELNRLSRLAPFPSDENLQRMKRHTNEYETAIAKLKGEVQLHVLPLQALAPNEFQSRLRVTSAAVSKAAQAKGIQLPDSFYLGFDEFASALPSEAAAPLLGQELAQIEWILNILIDAGIDSLVSFRRAPLPEEQQNGMAASNTVSIKPQPGAVGSAKSRAMERNLVEAAFVSTPAAVRKALNRIAGADEQLCIVRLLHVRSQQEKGPGREIAVEKREKGTQKGNSSGAAPLRFIVGEEQIETAATIEIVRIRL